MLPHDLQIGAMSQRTSFELDDGPDVAVATEADEPRREDEPDTDKKQRRRKALFFLGAGAAGFGVLGVTAFGIGGRVVQAQMSNGYDDGSLTRDREDTLALRGDVMNGMAIGSAVVGLAGIILAATVYGIDHARCGDLPPKRKRCPELESDEELNPVHAPSSSAADEPHE